MRKAYIVAAKRSAIGTFMGSLTDVDVADMGATVLKETIKQANIDPANLDEVIIGNVIAAAFANMISTSNCGGLPLLIFLFLATVISSLFLPNALNSWSIFSSTVPALMQVGVSPEFSQLVYRLGGSVAIGLTPVFVYFIVYLAFMETYNQSNKPVTMLEAVKYQMPFALVSLLTFLVVIVVWYIAGIPLGIGAGVAL